MAQQTKSDKWKLYVRPKKQEDRISLTPRRVDFDALVHIGEALLLAVGEDPSAPGLKDTPRRFASVFQEFFEYEPGNIDRAFEMDEEVVHADQMVVVRNIHVHSLCEHHLLRFDCLITIAYIPRNSKVLGLSKLARIAHLYAHRLQVQERLVGQIAVEIQRVTGSPDVAVYGVGDHSCMSTRGIRARADMVTSALRGRFKRDRATRAEFMSIAQNRGRCCKQ